MKWQTRVQLDGVKEPKSTLLLSAEDAKTCRKSMLCVVVCFPAWRTLYTARDEAALYTAHALSTARFPESQQNEVVFKKKVRTKKHKEGAYSSGPIPEATATTMIPTPGTGNSLGRGVKLTENCGVLDCSEKDCAWLTGVS